MKSEAQFERDDRLIADAAKIRYNAMVIDRAEGSRVWDVEGREYLDLGAGWGVASLGYSNPHVRHAVIEQLEKSMFAGLISQANVPSLDLAERLVDLIPGEFEKKVWFGLSGSDASEAAQRLIRMATGKQRLISFVGSWHGTSDATMALSGHPAFASSSANATVTKIPYPDPYRNPFGGSSEGVVDQCLGFLENYLFATICPPEDVAAIFVESIQSDGGDIVPPNDFLPKLRDLCDRYNLLLVVDDIKVGLGRTGYMFSYDHGGIEADLVLLGKSLGGGLPLSAIVGRREILDAGTGVALSTTTGNATSCAAGLATLQVIEEQNIAQHAATAGAYLQGQLKNALSDYPIVGDIRGRGMIQGIDLVLDPNSKQPDSTSAAKIVFRAWELGLILYYAGNWSNVLEFTPPLNLTHNEIDEGVAILNQAFQDVLAGKVRDEDIARFAGW